MRKNHLTAVEDSDMIDNMIRGETVRVTSDYDLFGTNINGFTGYYIQESTDGKLHLLYVPILSEWCELKIRDFELVEPGHITPEARNFISNLRKLEVESE